jgi:hypothetical protein
MKPIPPRLRVVTRATKVRVLARSGHEAGLEGARIAGSNAGATTDFETLAKLSAPTVGRPFSFHRFTINRWADMKE